MQEANQIDQYSLVEDSAIGAAGERESSNRPRSSRSSLFAPKDFLKQTSSAERSVLAQELQSAIIFFLENERPVYLEGLGIICFAKRTGWVSHHQENQVVMRHETARLPQFEKCSDLVSFQRSRFTNIVETAELARRIYPRLALVLQLRWSELDLRQLLRGLNLQIAREVVISGVSKTLSDLGLLFALHNRQGSSFCDWFAGADIFLKPKYRAVVKVGSPHVRQLPILEHPWEGLQAAYGRPLQVIKLELRDELEALGLDLSKHSNALMADTASLELGIFEIKREGEERVLLYCSDGLRRFGQSESVKRASYEFTVQLASSMVNSAPGLENVPLWPKRLFALGWLLLESCKSGHLKDGAGLSFDSGAAGDLDAHLRTIFITRFALFPHTQHLRSGAFMFRNIILLRDEETEVARTYGADHLLTLLEHRKLSQTVQLRRPAFIHRLGLSPQAAEVN